ncbi:hypothetical protein SDRG_02980 [Saprolegnia diclina VS20]|uniref:Uncharacterized protein n=1 Tax=Saprolegnia diclina (strain VS20) TaxID=1156394 RepID=T0QN94_SAPDV|nr:hypothetical protein SDRG_02980 [Saprolegnia diclina VS20]EQC39544.1 hypothetical protein SDRG_02980 [Saprolegnia diclina VS20]|eukprot:XP_008606816.1 hypothetical protein SDRG_02980 [Saprolegnia diclina VS20]
MRSPGGRSRSITLPLPVEVVQRYYDCLTHKVDRNGQPFDPSQYNLRNYVNGAKSALVFLHKDVCAISPELDAMMTSKEPLSMEGYMYLVETAIKPSRDPLLSKKAHAFLVFCWNLATRAASRATIMYEKITS